MKQYVDEETTMSPSKIQDEIARLKYSIVVKEYDLHEYTRAYDKLEKLHAYYQKALTNMINWELEQCWN